MAGTTKMIIITSNEDIIRQFSFKKDLNTHIIDLDESKQMTSDPTDENMIMNFACLAELSKLNSSKDQVYKRALDSPKDSSSKPAKTSKRSDITCAICGDQAIGFNYDVLSCASCKAFFRRNANQTADKIRCITGRDQCSVAHEVQRKCPKCRLQRCFAAGMRKDFILTTEEIQRRKQRLEENRKTTLQRVSTIESPSSSSPSESLSLTNDEIDRLLMDVEKVNTFDEVEDLLLGTLSIEDWIKIESTKSSFMSYFQPHSAQCTAYLNCSDRTSALVSMSEFTNKIALCFINFFRQINEFQELLIDDRLILIKYNLFPVFPIGKCYNYRETNDCCSRHPCEETDKHRRVFALFGDCNHIREIFINLTVSLVDVTRQNPTLLSLLLIILILTPGLSLNEEEPPLNDPLAVYRVQSYYTKLLWSYLVNESGEIEACRRFTRLLNTILRLQSSSKVTRVFFRDLYRSSNTVDKITPLMQSVLHVY